MEENAAEQVWNLEENSDFFHQELRSLEFRAYGSVLSAFRAGGELDEERKNILGMMRQVMGISEVRHKCEVRRVATNPRLTMIANKIHGCNTTQDWIDEGFCESPLPCSLPRFPSGQNRLSEPKVGEVSGDQPQTSSGRVGKMKPSLRDFRKAQKIEKNFSSMFLNGWVSSDNERKSSSKMKARTKVTSSSGIKRSKLNRPDTVPSSSDSESEDEISYKDLRKQGRIRVPKISPKDQRKQLVAAAKVKRVLEQKKRRSNLDNVRSSPDITDPANTSPLKAKQEDVQLDVEGTVPKRARIAGPKSKLKFIAGKGEAAASVPSFSKNVARNDDHTEVVHQTEIKTEDAVTASPSKLEFSGTSPMSFQDRVIQEHRIRDNQLMREEFQVEAVQRKVRTPTGKTRGGKTAGAGRGAAKSLKIKPGVGTMQQKIQHSKRKQLDEVRVELKSDGESDKEDSQDSSSERNHCTPQNGAVSREGTQLAHPKFDRNQDYSFSGRFEHTSVVSIGATKSTPEREIKLVGRPGDARINVMRDELVPQHGSNSEESDSHTDVNQGTSPLKVNSTSNSGDKCKEESEKSEDDQDKGLQEKPQQPIKVDSRSCSSSDEALKFKLTQNPPKPVARTVFPAPVFSTSLNLNNYNKKRSKIMELDSSIAVSSAAAVVGTVSSFTSTASSLARRPNLFNTSSSLNTKATGILPQRKAQPHILANSKVQRILQNTSSSPSVVGININSVSSSTVVNTGTGSGVSMQSVQLMPAGQSLHQPSGVVSPSVASVAGGTNKPGSYNIPITSIQSLNSFNVAGHVSYGTMKSSPGPNIIFLQKAGVGMNSSPTTSMSGQTMTVPSMNSQSNVQYNTVNVQHGKNSRAVILRRANLPRQGNVMILDMQKNQVVNANHVPQLLQTARILNSPAEIALIANLQGSQGSGSPAVRKVITSVQASSTFGSPSSTVVSSTPTTPMTSSSASSGISTPSSTSSSLVAGSQKAYSELIYQTVSSRMRANKEFKRTMKRDDESLKHVPSISNAPSSKSTDAASIEPDSSTEGETESLDNSILPSDTSSQTSQEKEEGVTSAGPCNESGNSVSSSSQIQESLTDRIDEFLGTLLGTRTTNTDVLHATNHSENRTDQHLQITDAETQVVVETSGRANPDSTDFESSVAYRNEVEVMPDNSQETMHNEHIEVLSSSECYVQDDYAENCSDVIESETIVETEEYIYDVNSVPEGNEELVEDSSVSEFINSTGLENEEVQQEEYCITTGDNEGNLMDMVSMNTVSQVSYQDPCASPMYSDNDFRNNVNYTVDNINAQSIVGGASTATSISSQLTQEVSLTEDIFKKALESSGLDFSSDDFGSSVTIQVDGNVIDSQDVAIELEISADGAGSHVESGNVTQS